MIVFHFWFHKNNIQWVTSFINKRNITLLNRKDRKQLFKSA
jgi:hypothetical protein